MKWAFAVLIVLFVSCTPQPSDPSATIELLKTTCSAACESTQTVNVTVPADWSLSATADGLCLKKETRLLCGTCACGTYGLMESQLAQPGAERSVQCQFTGDASLQTLRATCS